MNGRLFYDKIQQHEQLIWEGSVKDETVEKDRVIVSNHRQHRFAIPISTILKEPWEVLETILLEERPIKIMTQLSRIVGYYSLISNWNNSKKAELRDRQKGNYNIGESVDSAEQRRIA